jgi:hypothetical protein
MTETQTAELETRLREREVLVKEQELQLKRKWWGNPIFVGLLLAAAAIGGNAVTTWYQGQNALVLARQKFQYDLLQEALRTDDPAVAAKRLSFLLNLNLMGDSDGRIRYYIQNPDRLQLMPSGHLGKPINPPDAP